MTHETPSPSQPFANHYPRPQDQIAFEFQLRDEFAASFPESTPVMEEALADVQRFSGINIPKYKLKEAISEDAPDTDNLVDEMGYLTIGTSGYSRLTLKMPVSHTDEQISQMTDLERAEASQTHEGMYIVGDIPPETSALLNGLYGLTGAEVVRDDRKAGETEGTVLRRGEYQGTPVYFSEDYMDPSYYSGKPMMSVRILNKDIGALIAEELNHSQFKEFADAIGQAPHIARKTIADNGVNVNNYRQVADVLRQTRDVVDRVDPESRRESLGNMIDDLFQEAGTTIAGQKGGLPKFNRANLPPITTDKNGDIKITPELKKWLRIQKLPKSARKIGRVLKSKLGR
jgi:hypothetical protein